MTKAPPGGDPDERVEIPVDLDLMEASRVCAEWLQSRALWLGKDFTGEISLLSPVWIKVSVAAHEVRLHARCVQLTAQGAAFEFRDLEALRKLQDHVGDGDVPVASTEEVDAASHDGGGEEGVEALNEPADMDEDTGVEPDLVGEVEEGGGEGMVSDEAVDGSEVTDESEEQKTDGKGSLFHRLKALSIEEKKRLAVKANQPERHFLARDNAGGIHIYVLRNPGVTANEVADFLKYPRFSVEAILFVGKSMEWMSNRRVQMALCLNSRTPTSITRRLISKLGVQDLRTLRRSGKLNPVLAKEVKTRLMKLNV